jgi:alpha-galactosidase
LALLPALTLCPEPIRGDERPVEALPDHLRSSGLPTATEVDLVDRWSHLAFAESAAEVPWLDGWLSTGLPFDFVYDGRRFAELRREWPCELGTPAATEGNLTRDLTWASPDGLRVHCQVRRFTAFPAVDWLLSFENAGAADSRIIEAVDSLAIGLNRSPAPGSHVVLGAYGGRCGRDDFMPFRLAVTDDRPQTEPALEFLRQDFEQLQLNKSIIETPLILGDQSFAHGIGTHSVSHLRIHSPQPVARFSAWVGVDHNERTRGGAGSVVFCVATDKGELYRSDVCRGGEAPLRVEVDTQGARVIDLHVGDAGDGPTCDHADWAEATLTLGDGTSLRCDQLPRLQPPGVVLGSRGSSSNEQLPFLGIECPDRRGLLFGVGWTGQWRATVRQQGSTVTARAGLIETHFRLHPGETVRGPRVLMLAWKGETLHGQNLLRGLLHQHYVPRLRGRPQVPWVTVNTCFTHGRAGDFLEQAGEDTLRPLVQPFIELGAEALIVDAGWYRCKTWPDLFTTKDYGIDPGKYPHGFGPLSEPLRQAGVTFGLWCPPEALGRLDDPANRQRFLEVIDGFVREQGLGLYRQDAGFVPPAESADRVGVGEMQHIAGLYELLDEMRRRHPELVFEGCSGGGRRVDLETLSRFHWHQKSDRWFDSVSDQCAMAGANLFLPGGVLNLPTRGTDDVGSWSSFGGQFCLGWHPVEAAFPLAQARRQVELYKRVRECLSGDFYPLSEVALGGAWLAFQFLRRDLDRGFALIYRREATPGNAFRLALRGLDPARRYQLALAGAGTTLTAAGAELAAGLDIAVDQAPGAELVRLEAVP